MIISVETSVIKIIRISEDLNTPFTKRFFTKTELDYLKNKDDASIACVMATKEAVAKVLGADFNNFDPRDVEVIYDISGKPIVELYGKMLEATNVFVKRNKHCKSHDVYFAIQVCSSATDDIAVATAIILQKRDKGNNIACKAIS